MGHSIITVIICHIFLSMKDSNHINDQECENEKREKGRTRWVEVGPI